MPTYEYACRDCGHHLEVVQSFRDEPLQTCERCGGRLRKVFSVAGIIFKGSGYYVTDTRAAKEARASAGKPSSDGAKPGTGDGAKPGSGEGTSASESSSSQESAAAESA